MAGATGPGAQDYSAADRLKVAALSSLYSAYKRMRRAGDPLAREAEFLHAHSADRDWNESYYFNFIDPARRIGGYTRIGILPNQDNDVCTMMLYAGGKRLLVALEGGRAVADESGLAIGAIEFEAKEPLWRWRLRFSGEMLDIEDSRMLNEFGPGEGARTRVELDLLFEGVAPCFNFKNADARAVAEMLVSAGTRLRDARQVSRVSSEHYEQAGRYSGRLAFADREFEFSGGGHRDHSWGVRDWSAPRLWTWLTCQFSDELAFNLSRVAIGSVDIFNGFICRGGRNYPVRRARLETEFEEDGVTQKALRFALEDTGGKVIEVSGDVLTVIPLDLKSRGHSTLVNEALTEYRWGSRTGYGIAEYLHQAG